MLINYRINCLDIQSCLNKYENLIALSLAEMFIGRGKFQLTNQEVLILKYSQLLNSAI